ncbi:MAG: hypothetical protein ABJH82_00430 [Polaribacter sp.]|uniref:hypothetical protein n=1 Tax=Polaribacter sp. TaxID=1920175 RepID=UPI0032677B12
MKINKNKILLACMLFAFCSIKAQSFLKKKEVKAYKCGYEHKESVFGKLKPMKLISKATGVLIKAKPKSDLKNVALAVSYASGLIPQSQVDFATKVPGWSTCGDGVSVYFLNYEGIGLTDTDGDVKLNGNKLEKAGMGTYFQGFSPDKRGTQSVEVTSSSGDKVTVNIEPATPLEILSVNGIAKGGDIKIDGTKDVVIELKGGDADPNSELYVEMIISAMSLKVQTHLYPSKATNTITIPKEAFKNFENSPLPIIKKNTLSVTRVKNELIQNTDVGVIQKTATFSDFTPILIEGNIAGGSLLKNAFNKDKNTTASNKFKTIEGEYNVKVNKGNPYTHPPLDKMKKIGISSFVVRGNLFKKKTTVTTSTKTSFNVKTTTTTTTRIQKWFPKLEEKNWQNFVDNLYDQFKNSLQNNYRVNVIAIDKIINTKAYSEMKPIEDTVTKTFIEKGAYGTKRLIKTGAIDYIKDIKTTFAADQTNQKIIQQLNLDGLIAVTIDLDFDLESAGLNPVVKITAFSPNVSYRMGGKYFEMDFSTKAKSLKEAGTYTAANGPEEAVYKIIKGNELMQAFKLAMDELKRGEKENPAYYRIWKDRMN